MNHISLAHYFWKKHLNPGDIAIDATCGAGNDTLFLAEVCLTDKSGIVYGIDIQKEAIDRTETLITTALPPLKQDRVILLHMSHAPLPPQIPLANLIVYNLGYLPGSDKLIKTISPTSITSLESSLNRLLPGGMISVMLYPGHYEGLFEAQTILNWASALSSETYSLSHHYRPNNPKSPGLLIIRNRN